MKKTRQYFTRRAPTSAPKRATQLSMFASSDSETSKPLQPRTKTNVPASEWRLYLDNSKTAFSKGSSHSARIVDSGVTFQSPSSRRSNIIMSLYELIRRMPSFPETHPLNVDSESAQAAEAFLSLFAQYTGKPPQVFAHGGDALVFTWRDDPIEKYLTVIGDEFSLLQVVKATDERTVEDVIFDNDEDRSKWLSLLGGRPSTTTSVTHVAV